MAERPKPKSLTAAPGGAEASKSSGDQVVSRILDLVRTGNLKPGDRLPPERELIVIFSISRPSLREALRSLSMLGVIEARHGGGAYVTNLDAKTLLAPLDFFLSLTRSNLADAFDSRRVIEMEMVRRTALIATRKDKRELEDMLDAHRSVLDDPVGFRILDSRFHEKLYVTAGNAVLRRFADGLYNLGLELRRQATEEPGAIARSTEDHRRIFAAIVAGDPEAAAEAMRQHLNNIEESTLRMMKLHAPAGSEGAFGTAGPSLPIEA
jgi:GntR family transcriptional repressor for pyruvate dehydrogenase complex